MTTLIEDARRAMLRRLANDINVLAHAPELDRTCCYQDVPHIPEHGSGRREIWFWRFCNNGLPGQWFDTEPCDHWHHQHEPPLLA